MTARTRTCPNCGRQFTPWRGKRYCSEGCRKRAENRRLRALRGDAATPIANSQNCEKFSQQKQNAARAMRGDGPTLWIACNEVTQKLVREGPDKVLGWAISIEGRGWFGRVRDDRGDWSFGPSTRERARQAVEARTRHEPFEKTSGEFAWRGNCSRLLVGRELAPIANTVEPQESPSEREPVSEGA